jgi:hypothetical protein
VKQLTRGELEEKLYNYLYSLPHVHSVKRGVEPEMPDAVAFLVTLIPDDSNQLVEHRINVVIPPGKSNTVRFPDIEEDYALPEDENTLKEYLMLHTQFVIVHHRQ